VHACGLRGGEWRGEGLNVKKPALFTKVYKKFGVIYGGDCYKKRCRLSFVVSILLSTGTTKP